MPEFIDDRINDPITIISKVGHVMRDSSLELLTPMAERIYAAFDDGEVLFDVYFDGKGLKGVSFTEIFSQGLILSPCNDDLRYKMAVVALEDDDLPIPAEKVLAAGRIDKYRLLKGRDDSPLDTVILLPGTNLLDRAVDWVRVAELVKDGAVVKLHPITSKFWERRITQLLPGAVVGRRQSGFDMLSRARKVYSTSNSETGLLAILMDKEVGLVDSSSVTRRPIYRQIYEAVMPQTDRKAALEKLLGSRHGGIYWNWQSDNRPREIVQAMREMDDA